MLGLVKAQQVKNAVIVPVGAKGGFSEQFPPASDRQAWLAEGTDSYKTFVRTLLQLTDNLDGDRVVPPENTVRHDGDDPYLVVAADKAPRRFPTSPTVSRPRPASGSATPSLPVAARATTIRPWASPRAGPGRR